MASIRFSLSKKKDARGKSEILMRFVCGRDHIYRIKTHLFINPERWDAESERILIRRLETEEQKELVELKARMESLTNHMLDEFAEADQRLVDGRWMQKAVDRWWHPDTAQESFFDCFAKFIQERKGIGEERREQFWVLHRLLERYEVVRGRKILFAGVDTEFLMDLEDFIENEHAYAGMRRYSDIYEGVTVGQRSQNTIAGMMKKFRVFIKDCVRNGIIAKDPFLKYKVTAERYGTPYYLSIAERDALYRYDLSEHPMLEVQRDIFVFQCLTGPRYGDLCKFRKVDIVEDVLEYMPGKTKDNEHIGLVRVPLTDTAKEIVRKYSRIKGEKLFPYISLDKYNEALKKIFSMAGLDRMVSVLDPLTRAEVKKPLHDIATSHLARRTFVGNLYRQVKDQNLISSMSGHAEGSRAFARYRAIDDDIKRDVVKLLERSDD